MHLGGGQPGLHAAITTDLALRQQLWRCRLTTTIRALLRRYELRPPPLSPLAAALRSVCTLCTDPEAVETTPRSEATLQADLR